MAHVIALAGKGGTGKTTMAGLVVRALRRTNGPVLAVDADPNTCLDVTLGLAAPRSVSDVLDRSHGLRDVPVASVGVADEDALDALLLDVGAGKLAARDDEQAQRDPRDYR